MSPFYVGYLCLDSVVNSVALGLAVFLFRSIESNYVLTSLLFHLIQLYSAFKILFNLSRLNLLNLVRKVGTTGILLNVEISRQLECPDVQKRVSFFTIG